jgi:hypothetical protein
MEKEQFFVFTQEETEDFLQKITKITGAKRQIDPEKNEPETLFFELNTDLRIDVVINPKGYISAYKKCFVFVTGKWEEISEPHFFKNQGEITNFLKAIK